MEPTLIWRFGVCIEASDKLGGPRTCYVNATSQAEAIQRFMAEYPTSLAYDACECLTEEQAALELGSPLDRGSVHCIE